MSAGTFGLKLYTPAGLQAEDTVEWITLPSVNGEIGVLPHHTKYTGLLGVGVMSYLASGAKEATNVVITGGFCTFSSDTFVVLADSVDFPENIDRKTYSSERAALEKTVEGGDTRSLEWIQANSKLQHIAAVDKLLINK